MPEHSDEVEQRTRFKTAVRRSLDALRDVVAEIREESESDRTHRWEPDMVETLLRYIPDSYELVGECRLKDFTLEVGIDWCVQKCDCETEHSGSGDNASLLVPVYHVARTALDAAGNLYYQRDDGSIEVEPVEGGSPLPLASLTPPTGTSFTQHAVDNGLALNLLNFPSAYCFHPGAVAEDRAGLSTGVKVNAAPGFVDDTEALPTMTVDTGVIIDEVAAPGYDFMKPADQGKRDRWPADDVRGHGPAIADLIGGAIGDTKSELTQVDYGAGAIGAGFQFSVVDYKGKARTIRSFDTDTLHRTLHGLWDRRDPKPPFRVVNLSLGAVSCPERMGQDPVGAWLAAWLTSSQTAAGGEESGRRGPLPDRSRHAVVAAGNHGNCARSYPAAFTEASWSAGLNLYAVGSGSVGSPDEFSARGPWVTHWEPGANVSVAHEKFQQTVWTGTSFAAPQYAAKIATGQAP